MAKNVVAIIGRTNVGKSTLFNRIVGKRISIVDDSYGVTRDRIYRRAKWQNKEFFLIDTGGLEIKNTTSFQDEIKIQVGIALEEADIIIFTVDGRVGITSDDEYVANMLHKSNKEIVVVANKLENLKLDPALYSIGFEHIFPVSALHGDGVGNLLDYICENIDNKEEKETDNIKIAIIGKPNVGKSSLLNTLVNENRAIVSPIPGTTRDSVNSILKIGEESFEIIDTAGIVRKSRLTESVEHYALIRAMDSLTESDISLVLFDATEEFAHFHARIIGHAFEMNKPIILVVNKWDLIKKDTMTMANFIEKMKKEFQFVPWAKIVFISALTKQRITTLSEAITFVVESLKKRIKTFDLNSAVIEWQILKPAPNHNGGRLKILHSRQAENTRIPTFLLYVNNPSYLHFSYKRYLENRLREYFGFDGVPIQFVLKTQ